MSDKQKEPELAACPYCGDDELDITTKEPLAMTLNDDDMVRCTTEGCPSSHVPVTVAAWNRRYVCPDHECMCNTCDHKCGIEIIQEVSENEKIEILEALGWVYEESSDGTGDMFMYWDDPAKEMPEWCSDNTTSCECLDNVWEWYCDSKKETDK